MNSVHHTSVATDLLSAGQFTFYPSDRYFATVKQDIERTKRGDRVLLATMAFTTTEPHIQGIIDALGAAAQRGVTCTLSVDANPFLILNERRPGPLWFHKELPPKMSPPFQHKFNALHDLRGAGVKVGITNKPGKRFTSPLSGRSHIKATIINDKIYVGGCNLDELQFDLMAMWHDQKTADWLYEHLQHMAETESTQAAFDGQDKVCKLDDKTTLLIDAGKRDQSTIFERALAAIDRAEEWLVFTCQYFPHSVTAQHLKRARDRGVKVRTIFNHPGKHTFPHSLVQRAITKRERMRLPEAFFDDQLSKHLPYLHAKLIATEKEAVLGSHNYVIAGVNFGTAEIALHSRDPEFAVMALQTLEQQIESAN